MNTGFFVSYLFFNLSYAPIVFHYASGETALRYEGPDPFLNALDAKKLILPGIAFGENSNTKYEHLLSFFDENGNEVANDTNIANGVEETFITIIKRPFFVAIVRDRTAMA